jgi:hypothetical protein
MNVDTLAERLTAVEERLLQLEDEKAVREVLARYGYYADTCLDDDYIDLFTDDCVMDVSSGDRDDPYRVVEWQGKNSLRAFLTERSSRHGDGFRGNSMHVQGNNLAIRIDGLDAVATGYSFILRQVGDEVLLVSASINSWELHKGSGHWLVHRRTRRAMGAPDIAALVRTASS